MGTTASGALRLSPFVLTVTADTFGFLNSRSESTMAKRKAAEDVGQSPVSFENSLGELQAIVSELEDGSLGLESSLAQFERGVRLLRECYSILDAAEAKVEVLTRIEGIEVITVPFENSATFDPTRDQSSPGSNSDDDPSGESDDSGELGVTTLF